MSVRDDIILALSCNLDTNLLAVGGNSGSTTANGSLVSLGQHEPQVATHRGHDAGISIPEIRIDPGQNDESSDVEDPSPPQVDASKEALIPPLPFRSASSNSDVQHAAQVPLPPAGSDELEAAPPVALRPALKADVGQPTQRRKSVNFQSTRSLARETAPPEAVLARTEGAIEGTSAGGVGLHNRETNEVIMQGTMACRLTQQRLLD